MATDPSGGAIVPDVLRWPRGQFGRKAIDQAEFLVDLAALSLDCLLGVVARLPHLRHVALHDDADRVVRVLPLPILRNELVFEAGAGPF